MRSLPTRHRRADGKIAALRRLPSLSTFSEAQLLHLASLAELVDVPAARTLTREGTSAREAFLVVEGRLRVVRGVMTVTTLGPGDIAGDVALLDHEPRATGLETVTPARLAVFSRRTLQQAAHAAPGFTDLLLRQLATRVRSGVPT